MIMIMNEYSIIKRYPGSKLIWCESYFRKSSYLPALGLFTLQTIVHITAGPISWEVVASMFLHYNEWNFHSFSLSNWTKLEFFMLGLQGPTFFLHPLIQAFVLVSWVHPSPPGWLTLTPCSCLLEWGACFLVPIAPIGIYGKAENMVDEWMSSCTLSKQASRYKNTPILVCLHLQKHQHPKHFSCLCYLADSECPREL